MKINKIPRRILIAVRQNLGGKDEDDTQFDKRIIHLTPQELMEYFCGWHLGDRSWGRNIIQDYEILKGIDKTTEE